MLLFTNVLIGFVIGMIFPIQATLGSRLNSGSQNKFIGTFVAFTLGNIILFLINSVTNPSVFFSLNTYLQTPLMYLIGGGLVGVIYNALTMNLFSKIGAFYTTVFTLVGQLLTGLIIDTLGLFAVTSRPLSILSILGVSLTIGGSIYANQNKKDSQQKISIPIIIGTIALGSLPPLQQVFNGSLSSYVGSPILATFLSFFIGTLSLVIFFLITKRSFVIPKIDQNQNRIPLPFYLGGMGGIAILMGNILILPVLGSTFSIVISLIGQFVMSILLDHFGLLGIRKQNIHPNKYIAVVLMIIGSLLIKL